MTKLLASLDHGVRFDDEKMKMVNIEELIEEDQNTPDDIRTMDVLKKIKNKVYGCMQFTTDCPSIHVEGMVPVLDLNMYIWDDGLVKYQFYEKPCSNKFVIPYNSAHSTFLPLFIMMVLTIFLL